MINPIITRKIDLITNYLVDEYSEGIIVDLVKIAEAEGIRIHVDDYENYFDGMFVIDEGNFHIHLNSNRGNYLTSGRGRFSLAHELGHYLIENHYEDILKGKLLPHPSFQTGEQRNDYEVEADCFAANLLMPKEKFYNYCSGQKFSWQLIEDLSNAFGTSRFATLLRFIKVLKHELFIIGSSLDGIIKWFNRNEDFPKMKHKFKRGGRVPANARANHIPENISSIVEAMPEDWFVTWGEITERPMYEQCFNAKAYDTIITMLWYD